MTPVSLVYTLLIALPAVFAQSSASANAAAQAAAGSGKDGSFASAQAAAQAQASGSGSYSGASANAAANANAGSGSSYSSSQAAASAYAHSHHQGMTSVSGPSGTYNHVVSSGPAHVPAPITPPPLTHFSAYKLTCGKPCINARVSIAAYQHYSHKLKKITKRTRKQVKKMMKMPAIDYEAAVRSLKRKLRRMMDASRMRVYTAKKLAKQLSKCGIVDSGVEKVILKANMKLKKSMLAIRMAKDLKGKQPTDMPILQQMKDLLKKECKCATPDKFCVKKYLKKLDKKIRRTCRKQAPQHAPKHDC